jgi:hypothetical protein
VNEGVKFDGGKVPLELIPPSAMFAIGQVLAYGATKYAPHNWRKGLAWSRLIGAAMRHLMLWAAGHDKDSETGLSHLAHAGCCIVFLITYEMEGLGTDDRQKESLQLLGASQKAKGADQAAEPQSPWPERQKPSRLNGKLAMDPLKDLPR